MKYTLLLFSIVAVSVNAQTSDKLVVIPSINDSLQKDKVNFYCSTFQIVWNSFKLFIGEEIKIKGAELFSEKMNNGNDAELITPSKYSIGYSGFCREKEIIKFNRKLKCKFGKVFEPLTVENDSNRILFASYLYQKLKFRHKYQKIGSYEEFKDYNGNVSRVKSWGISPENAGEKNGKKLSKTITIYNADGRNFAISLKTKSGKYEIILAENTPRPTMVENIAFIDSIISNTKPTKYKKIILKVPVIEINADRVFNELLYKSIANEQWAEWVIGEAFQKNKFELNQDGAIIKSHAQVKAYRSVGFSSGNNAFVIDFDKPFMIMLKEKNAKYPYVAIWMGNNYGMKKYPNDTTE